MKKILIAVLTLLLTATLLLSVTNTTAQVEEAVEVVSIPDANLAAAIRDALGLPTDAVITAQAMRNLTHLEASGSGIATLAGLEYATQLAWLNLGDTDVSDISALANLTQLQTLYLLNTGVSDISALANLTQLERLNLSNTAVSDVSPLSALMQLTWLGLAYTPVSDISPLSAFSQLEVLYLDDTDVLDISPLSALSQLTRLGLIGTAVSDISPLSALTQLTSLRLAYTAVSDVSPLSALTQLTELSLENTGVSDVSPLVNLTQLEWLNLQNCPLNADAYQTHIPTIQANRTEVTFSPFKPIHLQQVPWLVSLIYFRPSDRPVRPNVDAEIDGLIKKAQRFFADQLELHGFGKKTFQFETDARGNAVVHHVNGKFPNAHYQQNSFSWVDEIREQIYIPARSITVQMLDSDPDGRSFTGHAGTGGGGNHGGSADIDYWDWKTIAHELAHAFGLTHDWRADANAKRIRTFTDDPMLTSFCAAEWLSVHPAFNPGQPVSTSNATIKMLPPTLASPPNTIRLRFEVTDLDGLHQAQLQIPDFVNRSGQYSRLIDYQQLTGVHDTVEFVTTQLTPQIKTVTLSVIDVRGHMSTHSFPIDVSSLLPPAKVVSIPDPNLAAAVREALELSVSEAITTHAMLALPRLSVPNRGIKDLTGLEHATNLTALNLSGEYISGGGFVDSNAISDWSPLAALPQLTWLNLRNTGVSDVSPLAALTQLDWLDLGGTGVSDISALANLTQLEQLYLYGTDVSDISPLTALTQLHSLFLAGTDVSDISALANLTQLRELFLYNTDVSDILALANLAQLEQLYLHNCPLSYASIHTHIPAMQAKGIEVAFDNVAHPALLKNSGNRQEGEPGATLKTPFVVEAMDEHGKPIVGKTVQFSVLEGEGTLSAKTVETDARGKARVTLTLGWYPGVNKVKASSEGIQSWVLFTAAATEEAPQLVADVNGDGVVNIQDLVLVSGQFGETGKNNADVNGDGVVNIQDLVLVASAFGEGAAAPSARAVSLSRLTASDVEAWLSEARSVGGTSLSRYVSASRLMEARSVGGTSLSRYVSASRTGGLSYGEASRTGSLSYLRGIAVLEQLLASLMPKATVLLANYPNPFNPETWIPYQLANPAEVTVTIYAANGAVVRTLDFGHRRAGSYASRSRAAYWDGRNAQGEPVASGVYFYTLTAGDFAATRKMLILK